MFISNKKLYLEMLDQLQKWESEHYKDTSFAHGIMKQNIKEVSAADLKITKSIVKVDSIKPSQYYNNHTLISAINIYQDKLKDLLHDTLEQTSDIFVVWLCYQGEWKYVISDDRVPCSQNNQLATLECEYQWPILIEKAIAKLIGNGYSIFNNKLANNSIESYLHLLMGSPIDVVNYETFDQFVKQLDSKQIHYIQKKQENKMLYCYLESYKVQGQQQLIKLKAVNEDSIFSEGQNIQGTYFYLTWKQIQEAMSRKNVFVIRLQQNYYVNTIELKESYQTFERFPNKIYTYKYTVNQASDHIFTVCQFDQMFNKKQKEEFKYAMIRFMIFKIVDKKYQLIDGIYINKKHVILSLCLQKGDYILYIEGQFYNIVGKNDASEHQTDLKLQIQSVHEQSKLEKQDIFILKQLIYSIALQQANQKNTTILTKDKRAQRTYGEVFGLYYIVCQNFSTIEVEEDIDCSQCENLIDFQSQIQLTKFQMSISPNQYKMQIFTFDPTLMEQLDQPSTKFHFQIQQNKGDGTVTNQIITGIIPQTLHNALKKERKNIITNDMCVYVKQHDQGVSILFENDSTNTSNVNIQFSASNLSFKQTDDINVILQPDNSMNLTLNGRSSSFILFDVIDVNKTHNFALTVLSQINN